MQEDHFLKKKKIIEIETEKELIES